MTDNPNNLPVVEHSLVVDDHITSNNASNAGKIRHQIPLKDPKLMINGVEVPVHSAEWSVDTTTTSDNFEKKNSAPTEFPDMQVKFNPENTNTADAVSEMRVISIKDLPNADTSQISEKRVGLQYFLTPEEHMQVENFIKNHKKPERVTSEECEQMLKEETEQKIGHAPPPPPCDDDIVKKGFDLNWVDGLAIAGAIAIAFAFIVFFLITLK